MQGHMHHKRRLLIALAMTGGFTAGLATLASPANAVVRTFEVTGVLGKKTITLDIGADTPIDQIRVPGINLGAILSIRETTPAQAPPSTGTPALSIKPTAPTQIAPVVPAAPVLPVAPTRSGKKKAKPSAGQPVFDSAGRLLRAAKPERARPERTKLRFSSGLPTMQNPTLSLASLGPVPVGVPNFFINKFRIPPFLLSIYQAAGIQYGIRWEVLAAINEIETDYGRNLNVSSAGAMGWMQFIPSSWKTFGVDANSDGKKDPYNPVDAIFAAARYLKAAGADTDLRKAIFAYNHADWYVDSVLMRARFIGGMPADLVGSLSGLTQGLFPVHAAARYADDISEREALRRVARGKNAALPVESKTTRRGINIFAKPGAPVVAVQDGKIVKVGENPRLGKFVMLRDVYGNTYTYAGLKKVAAQVPVPKEKTQSKASIAKELALPKGDPAPKQAASAPDTAGKAAAKVKAAVKQPAAAVQTATDLAKERLFANPTRPNALSAGGKQQIMESESELAAGSSVKSYFTGVYGLNKDDVVLKRLVPGRKVIAGTILGRIGKVSPGIAPNTMFEIRPAGRGAPRIDPKPILDGWKLLESTAIYRARSHNPFFGPDAKTPSIGQILLMGKGELERRVLHNPRIEIYGCGRRDIKASRTDRRVLATLEFLAASGLRPTVTSLTCGHSYFTASGNVSHHSTGSAVDIAAVNGIVIQPGTQGKGSITDLTIQRLLTLQGTMKPSQIISLMTFEGADNTYAMGDHHDHIHVGFQPLWGANGPAGEQFEAVLKPSQWIKLIDRLGEIDNPTVRTQPSKYAITVTPPKRASGAHRGE